MLRINIGCGQTPTRGWRNFDNSWSLRLSKIPVLATILRNVGLLETPQYQFIQFARSSQIEYGDATKRLPLPNGSVEVLYTSHMIEHLDRKEVDTFLKETHRVLRSGGVIRLAVPDLKKQVTQYLESGDANAFIEATHLCVPRPKTISQRLRILFVGTHHHHWMYDGVSLTSLLQKKGFVKPKILPAGETRIENHDPLDLYERSSESVYVEAEKP